MKKQFRSILFFLLMIFSLCISLLPVNAEETTGTIPDNGIPVVYVDIDESQGTIEDMIASEDHCVCCYGTVSIDVPEGFHYADFPEAVCESVSGLAMSIRGRGNSTWVRNEKKPFKIKLDKKADIFGLGKNKHWVLLANASDESLIRDRISAWLGDQMGFEFTPRGVPVDFVMRGSESGEKYLGSYYFTENVRVDTNRLEIDELEEDDSEYPDITGGYLVKVGTQEPQDSPNVFKTDRGLLLATDTPDYDVSDGGYDNPAQQEYIRNHLNYAEKTVFEEGTAYRELFDIPSAAKYWLFQDFCKNFDAWVTGSTYFYKKRDVDGVTGKIFFGPLWDFDFAYDYGYTTAGHTDMFSWMKPMFRDKEEGGFADEILKQWPVMRESLEELIADGSIIDQYYAETKASAEADSAINFPGDSSDYDYLSAVTKLKDWIRNRLEWYEDDFANFDHLVNKVWFMCDDQELDKQYVMNGKILEMPEEAPVKEGYIFLGWYDEDGNNLGTETEVTKDMVITAKYVAESEATCVEDLAMRKDNDVIIYSARFNQYLLDYAAVPSDAQDTRFEWTSSDESIAVIDPDGMVTTFRPGTVVFTAVMKNGNRRTFTLHILEEGTVPLPESIFPKEEVIYMTPGQQLPLYIDTVPSPARLNVYNYATDDESVVTADDESVVTADDESVVTADDYGILTAGNEGTTKVKITCTVYTSEEDLQFETEVTVIVSENHEPDPEPEPEPPVITYTVVSGDTASYSKGSKAPVTITVQRSENDESCFSHFLLVKADGKELKKDKDYTAVSGSTVVTLKASYLESLNAGNHEIEIVFDDGSAKVTLNVKKEDKKKTSPDTSDSNQSGLYAEMMFFSLLIFITAFVLRRRAY